MKKILPIEKVREADAYTMEHEPIKSIDLMERAAETCYNEVIYPHFLFHHDKDELKIFVGLGNNGGDGLVLARLLAPHFRVVYAYVVRHSSFESPDFLKNIDRLQSIDNVVLLNVLRSEDIPKIRSDETVIDAIFGSGLNRPPSLIAAEVIQAINRSRCEVISIDMPSGLFADVSSTDHKDLIINADITCTFAPLKRAFLYAENAPFFGRVECLDIGLSDEFFEMTPTDDYLVENEVVSATLKNRPTFSHKGDYGHALLLCGSRGKFGAALLATAACLRSGVGLLTVHTASDGTNILQSTCPEAMLSIDSNAHNISELPPLSKLERYAAVGIGPGIGTEKETQNVVKWLIQNYARPIVFDADAINILAENPTWLSFLPQECIFTPHRQELVRLLGKDGNDYELNELQREFSKRYRCYVVQKGHRTAITTPDGSCLFNTTGNAGMATGGSGDVLAGFITGLLARGYSPIEAAFVGVYLHGLAGDLAAEVLGQEAMKAGDIVRYLSNAFLHVEEMVQLKALREI